MDDAEREEGGRKEKRTGAEQLVPYASSLSPVRKIGYLDACKVMSGIPRPEGLPHKLQSKNRSDQVTKVQTLKEAPILIAEVAEEVGHGLPSRVSCW